MRRLRLGLLVTVVAVSTAQAYFLDKGRDFDVRLRAYSQLAIMTDSSETQGFEREAFNYRAGDLASQRNFYNPEFDAKLTGYTRWMGNVVGPDDFKFRFAWWGFYDGLYDYMNGGWDQNRRLTKARFAQSDHPERESFAFNDENKNP